MSNQTRDLATDVTIILQRRSTSSRRVYTRKARRDSQISNERPSTFRPRSYVDPRFTWFPLACRGLLAILRRNVTSCNGRESGRTLSFKIYFNRPPLFPFITLPFYCCLSYVSALISFLLHSSSIIFHGLREISNEWSDELVCEMLFSISPCPLYFVCLKQSSPSLFLTSSSFLLLLFSAF